MCFLLNTLATNAQSLDVPVTLSKEARHASAEHFSVMCQHSLKHCALLDKMKYNFLCVHLHKKQNFVIKYSI